MSEQTEIRLAVVFLLIGMQLSILNAALADCPEKFGCPTAEQVDDLKQNLDLYRDAMIAGQYVEAEVLAKRVIESSIFINGHDSVNSANALTNLAFAQYRLQQYRPAKRNYMAAIQTIEQADGLLSADLIRPLQGLGETNLVLTDIEPARDAFERAVHISHVNEGPRNPEQIESLNAIAETYMSSGSFKSALDIQKNIYALNAREVGIDSEEFIPALKHHVEWMSKLGLHNRARDAYRKMLKLQQTHLKKSDPNMIPTLIALAGSPHNFGNVPFDTPYVYRAAGPDYYLRRALRIAAAQPPSNRELAADTALAVGDLYTRIHRFGTATYAYREAWRRMSDDADGLRMRREEMEWPVLLEERFLPEFYENQMPLYEPTVTDNFLRGKITAKYNVTFSGRPVRIKLIESRPAGLTKIERRFAYTLKHVMHRPRMEDGSKIATRDLLYTYEFFYRN